MRTWLARIFSYRLQIHRLNVEVATPYDYATKRREVLDRLDKRREYLNAVQFGFEPVTTHELCVECGADEMTDHPDGLSGQCGACGFRQ
jgi:ribosomal protein S27AE